MQSEQGLLTVRMYHRIMERCRSDSNAGVDVPNDHSIRNDDDDDEDEESILARVLLESQSSFLLEQQNIYINIFTADTNVEQNICSKSVNDSDDDTINGNNSFSQWYDYRQYNIGREASSVQGKTNTCCPYASNRDVVVVDDDRDYGAEGTSKDMFDDHDEAVQQTHLRDELDDLYTFEPFPSFRKSHSYRSPRRRSSGRDINCSKMPSQSSIFTHSTCDETTSTSASMGLYQAEDQHEPEQEDEIGPDDATSSFISDDMIILEQIRILRGIQEQQLLQGNRHHPSTSSTSDNVTTFVPSKMPARNDDINNFLHDSGTDGEVTTPPMIHQRFTKTTGGTNTGTTTTINSTSEMAARYSHDVVVPYPDGTTMVRVRGVQHLHRSTTDLRQRQLQERQDEETNISINDDDDDNIVTTQCTHCTMLSQVVRNTCPFLFCVQCQEISPIVPMSRCEVIYILQQQQLQM